MTPQPDCPTLTDTLDALFEGRLSTVEREAFRRHARSCAPCAAILRLHDHLVPHTRPAMGATVPAEVEAAIWPGVQAALSAPPGTARTRHPRHGSPRWLAGALAAAVLALAVVSGFLLSRLGELRHRERHLADRVAEMEHRLRGDAAAYRGDPAERTARLAGTASWERALRRRRYVRVSELQQLLRDAPVGRTILDSAAAQALAREAPPWAGAMGRALAGIDIGDGMQVEELLLVLDRLALAPETRVPTADLFPTHAGS